MLSRFLKNRVYAGVAIGLLITAISAVGLLTGLFFYTNENFADTLYTRHEPSQDIVIIAIDDKSTDPMALGRYSQWTRDNFTNLLKVLEKENPKVLTMDFVFHTFSDGVNTHRLLELQDSIDHAASNAAKLQDYNDFLQKFSDSSEHPIDNAFADELAKFPNLILDAIRDPNGQTLTEPLVKFTTTSTLGVANTELDKRGLLKATKPITHLAGGTEDYDDVALATAKKYLEKIKLEDI